MRRFVHSAIAALLVAAAATGCASSSAGVEVVQAGHSTGSPSSDQTSATSEAPPGSPAPLDGTSGIGDALFPDLGNPGLDVMHYDIDVTYDPQTSHLDATTTLTIRATTDLAQFTLDAVDLDVTDVEVDGSKAGFTVAGPELVIAPDDPIANGDMFEVAVTYSAVPQRQAFGANGPAGWFETDGGSYVVNEPDGARTWLPSNDHPSDKATYHFTIRVPAGLSGVANGSLLSHTTEDGHEVWVWDQPEPMATYLIQVLTGHYELVDGVGPNGLPMLSAIQQGDRGAMQPFLDATVQQIDFFDDYFGPYPFASYGIAMTDVPIGGAIEEQGRSLFSRVDFQEGLNHVDQLLLSHELTHQWFGDSVTPAAWEDLWLSESFATYGEWMWLEHVGLGTLVDSAQRSLDARRHTTGITGRPSADDLFSFEEYEGGAVVLHALRRTVGDDAFFEILNTWSHDNYGESRTSQDFIALASSVAGQDLTAFFETWLYSADLPDQFPG